jgi:hypothetical protein
MHRVAMAAAVPDGRAEMAAVINSALRAVLQAAMDMADTDLMRQTAAAAAVAPEEIGGPEVQPAPAVHQWDIMSVLPQPAIIVTRTIEVVVVARMPISVCVVLMAVRAAAAAAVSAAAVGAVAAAI